jgi:hypothetical protein
MGITDPKTVRKINIESLKRGPCQPVKAPGKLKDSSNIGLSATLTIDIVCLTESKSPLMCVTHMLNPKTHQKHLIFL